MSIRVRQPDHPAYGGMDAYIQRHASMPRSELAQPKADMHKVHRASGPATPPAHERL